MKYLWAALESLYGLECGTARRVNHRFGEGNRFCKTQSVIHQVNCEKIHIFSVQSQQKSENYLIHLGMGGSFTKCSRCAFLKSLFNDPSTQYDIV